MTIHHTSTNGLTLLTPMSSSPPPLKDRHRMQTTAVSILVQNSQCGNYPILYTIAEPWIHSGNQKDTMYSRNVFLQTKMGKYSWIRNFANLVTTRSVSNDSTRLRSFPIPDLQAKLLTIWSYISSDNSQLYAQFIASKLLRRDDALWKICSSEAFSAGVFSKEKIRTYSAMSELAEWTINDFQILCLDPTPSLR